MERNTETPKAKTNQYEILNFDAKLVNNGIDPFIYIACEENEILENARNDLTNSILTRFEECYGVQVNMKTRENAYAVKDSYDYASKMITLDTFYSSTHLRKLGDLYRSEFDAIVNRRKNRSAVVQNIYAVNQMNSGYDQSQETNTFEQQYSTAVPGSSESYNKVQFKTGFESLNEEEQKRVSEGNDAGSNNAGSGKKGGKGHASQSKTENDDDTEKDDELEALISRLISSGVIMTSNGRSFDDVAGMAEVKRNLKDSVITPLAVPQLFANGRRRPFKGVLLFSAPGNGKTFIVQSLLGETIKEGLDVTFITATSSSLMSKWQGESEKIVKALFTLARRRAPSVVFLDEVDGFASNRKDDEDDSVRRIKNEFLVQMDGANSNGDGKLVMVLGATNVPYNIDPAVRRRFERRIYVDMPDLEARIQIIKHGLKGIAIKSISEGDEEEKEKFFAKLGSLTEHFSAADISIICNVVSYLPIRLMEEAQSWCRVRSPNDPDSLSLPTKVLEDESKHKWQIWEAGEVSESECIDTSLIKLGSRHAEVIEPHLSKEIVANSFINARSSVSERDLLMLKAFNEEFGSGEK